MASGWMTRLQDSGSEGTLALALALGHELGIFDVIMTSDQPMTSVEIAEKGKLKERYVREWLGCMVAGEVIQVVKQDNSERYFIAEDHKGVLNSICISARFFASYAVRYDTVKACFRQDGPNGVNHKEFPDVFSVFHVMRESLSRTTIDNMLPLIENLTHMLDDGIEVADLGCGTGVLILELAKRYPKSNFHGCDISEDGLAIARQHLEDSGVSNLRFSNADLTCLPEAMHSKYDWILAYDVIHDLSQPLKALNEINKCLKPGGLFVMGDIHTPKDRCGIPGDNASMVLYGISTFLCLPASADDDGTLGPGAAWSIEEAQALIAESNLKFIKSVYDKPYFAYHICQKEVSMHLLAS